jgi:hypothetical protein
LGRDGYGLKELWEENLWVVDARGVEIATAFVLQDSDGREIDAHAMRLDARGDGFPAWDAEGRVLGAQDLAAEGMIAGFSVRCMTPEMQMACHTGYELPDVQCRDLELLHRRLGVEYPDEATGQRISGHAAAGDHALGPQA